MKKLRNVKTKKGKAAKLAQRKLHEQVALLDSAKECHSCGHEFNKADPGVLDWQVRVTPAREVQLTCVECLLVTD